MAATNERDSCERATQPIPGWRRRGVSTLEDCERAPHGGSAEAEAVTTREREDPKLTFATKTDDDTERQLVHTLAHAIVFIVSSCCSSKFGAVYICPFLLEQRGSPKPGRPKL